MEKHLYIRLKHNISLDTICTVNLCAVSENAKFLIDIDIVPFSDLKSNDLGSLTTKGTKAFYFKLTDKGVCTSDLQPTLNNTMSIVHAHFMTES